MNWPFKSVLVIVSKAVPYLILSLVNVGTILLLSIFVLDLPIAGNLLLLLAESTLFIITCLTLGIFISIKTASQQVAMLISLIGGVIGIAIGIVATLLVSKLSDLPIALNAHVIGLATAFSIATGLFFGYYPARKASLLDPIEALRQQ